MQRAKPGWSSSAYYKNYWGPAREVAWGACGAPSSPQRGELFKVNYRGGRDRDNSGIEETVVRVNRVAKVVKGGKRFSFSALVVVGDRKGKVGFAIGKAGEVPEAIRKGVEQAKKAMITVPMVERTIPHEVTIQVGAGRVFMKPAAPGTGVIAGGPMRAVLELAGIHDILTKSLGSSNPINVVLTTYEALRSLRTAESIAKLRDKTVAELYR